MSGDLVVSLRIGGAINSSFTGTLRQVDGHLGQLGKTTEQLTAQSLKLGDTLEESTQRPLGNLEKLRVGYERIAHTFDVLKQKTDSWSASLASQRQEIRADRRSIYTKAVLASAPFVGSVMSAASFQDSLRDTAITGGFSATEENNLGNVIRKSALDWNQTQESIASGIGVLVAGGLSDVKDLEIYAPKLAKISTATRASMEDLGSVAISLKDSLGITAAGFDRSMNMLAFAGKQGQFELKDMAKWLPNLAPSFASLGVQGEEAVAEIGAALQIARKGAGSNDEAANNFRNFLGKLTSEDTKKSFADAGVDIEKSMLNLRAKGFTPVTAMLSVVQDYMTKKSPEAAKSFKQVMGIKDDTEREQALSRLSEAYKLGELFSDMQAMNFIRPAIANMEELNSIKLGATTAASQDVIGADFNKRMAGASEQFKQLKIGVMELVLELGTALMPMALELVTALKPMVYQFTSFIKQNPELIRGVAKAAMYFIGFKLTILEIKFALNLVLTVAVALLGTITLLSVGMRLVEVISHKFGFPINPWRLGFKAIMMLGRGLLWLSSRVFMFVLRDFLSMSAAIIMSPIGAAIAGIAVGGLLIYKYWQPIKGFFVGFWNGLSSVVAPALQKMWTGIVTFGTEVWESIKRIPILGDILQWIGNVAEPIWNSIVGWLKEAWTWFGNLLTPVEDVGNQAQNMGERVGQAIGNIIVWIIDLPSKFIQLGGDIVDGLINGIKNRFTSAKDTIIEFGQNIKGWFTDTLGIQSPSRIFMGFGDNIVQGAALGIHRTSSQAEEAAQTMARRVADTAQSNNILANLTLNAGANGIRGGGHTITFSPVIHITAAASGVSEQVQQGLNIAQRDFERMLDRVLADRQRRAF